MSREIFNRQHRDFTTLSAATMTTAGFPATVAGPGYDQVTGWGSPNIALPVAAFPGAVLSAYGVLGKALLGSVLYDGRLLSHQYDR